MHRSDMDGRPVLRQTFLLFVHLQGLLGIRVRSFLETVEMGREKKLVHEVKPLAEPYPVKFKKKAVKKELYLCQILLTRSAVSCLRHFPHRESRPFH